MTFAEILAARMTDFLRLEARIFTAFLRYVYGLSPPASVPPIPKPAALTLPWSPLARMVIAINIDKATPGGIR